MLFSRNLIRTFLALLALGALPLSAEEQPVPAQGGPAVSITDLKPVKLERDAHSKLLVAQCTVNGVPCNLIVDTAASHTTFDIKFIKKNFPGLPLEDVQIAPGSNVRAAPRLFAMRSFSMGGLHIKNFFGLALDLTPPAKGHAGEDRRHPGHQLPGVLSVPAVRQECFPAVSGTLPLPPTQETAGCGT